MTRIGCAIFVLILLGAVVAFEYFNLSGFCFSERRYLGEQELIDKGVWERIKNRSSDRIPYESLEDFYRRNPACCELAPWDPFRPREWLLFRLLGAYSVAVGIHYRMSDDDPEYPYYQAYITLNACGRYAGHSGIQEKVPPPRRPQIEQR